MKTAIVYYSGHHGNTKKLLDAIASQHEVTLINVTKQPETDLSVYDRIGFASGIYYSSFAKQLIAYARENLPAVQAAGRDRQRPSDRRRDKRRGRLLRPALRRFFSSRSSL